MKDKNLYFNKLAKILSIDDMLECEKDRDVLIDYGYDFIDRGEYKKAFRIFCSVIKLYGNDIDSLNGIGVSLCELGKLNISKLVFEKIIEMYPDDAITYANLAGVYWEKDDIGKSIYYYYKSLESDPTLVETHFNLINLYYEQGHLFTAYIACQNLLDIYPDNIQAKETMDDIILDMGITVF